MVKDNKLYISEIFKSIDGEGFHAGQATVFVRLFGCNLRCPWCFGIVPGRKEPVFRRSYLHPGEKGQNTIKLSEIKVGDWILTYDEDLNVVETQVQETLTREVSEWQKVVVDNVPYFVTGNHIFFTTRGEVAAKDLASGDIILDVKPGTLNSFRMRMLNPMKDPETAKKSAAHTNYDEVSKILTKKRKEIFGRIKDYKEKNVPFSEWDEKSQQYELANQASHAEELRKKMSESKKGEKNPNWKGGTSVHPNYDLLKEMIRQGDITRSQLSGKTLEEDNSNYFVIHHIDGNHDNDAEDNLIIVTVHEHNQIHERGYNFWKGNRSDGRRLSKIVEANGKVVQSNERIFDPEHPLTVYNVSCTPYNTYFIDNMWVHNCDTKTTWTEEQHEKIYGRKPIWMTVDEIVAKVEELEQGWPYKSICLTGGEPLMEENKELVEQLIEDLISKGYGVNIETNGAVDYKYWLDMHVFPSLVDAYGNRTGMSLITDWKLPSSKMNHKMIQSNLKILRECDLIKCVISDDPEDWTAFEEQVCKSGTKAKIYLSPCFGQVTMSKIPQFVVEHPEYNISCQLQQHKIFYSPDMIGV